MNEDEVPNGDDLERMVEREDLIWELWIRLLALKVMPSKKDYDDWLDVRAKRSPEGWYGIPED
jgi:hypothetical protein